MADQESPEDLWKPSEQISDADKATFTLEMQDGVPVLKMTGGRAIPQTLTVVDQDGKPLAVYAAGVAKSDQAQGEPGPRTRSLEGIHVQWELPEALNHGLHMDTTETIFPLRPNRWVVIRRHGAFDQR